MDSSDRPLTPAERSWLIELFERTVDGAYNVAYGHGGSLRHVHFDEVVQLGQVLIELVEVDPAESAIRSELARLLDCAIRDLPDLLRAAFVLRDVEELPMNEVAHVLEIGESAAKMRVARARESLRITLAGRI